jgi:hypothetical protein
MGGVAREALSGQDDQSVLDSGGQKEVLSRWLLALPEILL